MINRILRSLLALASSSAVTGVISGTCLSWSLWDAYGRKGSFLTVYGQILDTLGGLTILCGVLAVIFFVFMALLQLLFQWIVKLDQKPDLSLHAVAPSAPFLLMAIYSLYQGAGAALIVSCLLGVLSVAIYLLIYRPDRALSKALPRDRRRC